MEVDEGSDQKNQTSFPTRWLRMRVWRMSLRRTKSAIIAWAGSITKFAGFIKERIKTYEMYREKQAISCIYVHSIYVHCIYWRIQKEVRQNDLAVWPFQIVFRNAFFMVYFCTLYEESKSGFLCVKTTKKIWNCLFFLSRIVILAWRMRHDFVYFVGIKTNSWPAWHNT